MTFTANENLLRQTVRSQILLHSYSNSVVQDILSLLNAADKELVAKLRERMDAGKGGSWTSGRLRVLIKELAEISAEGYRNAQDRLFDEMVGFAEHEAEHAAEMLAAQKPSVDGMLKATATKINAVFSIVQPTAEQLAAMVSKEPITVGPQGKLLFEEIFKGLADGKETRIRQAIRLGLVEGEGTDQIVRRLVGTRAQRYADGIIERDRRGAEAMVRTITSSVSNKAMGMTYSANADIVKGVQWVATMDSRVTVLCASRDGMVFPVNDGPRPPAHINCLPGDSLVSPRGKILAVSKRWYDGNVVVIKTASGKVFTSTPNHPVLTGSGWVKAGTLNVGGNVVCDSGGERGCPVDSDNKNVPARIEDIAEAFFNSRKVVSGPVPISAEDFHGDGVGSEVAIIGADRELCVRDDTPVCEHSDKISLVARHHFPPGSGSTFQLLISMFHAAHCIVRRLSKSLSFLCRETGHTGELLFTPVSSPDPHIVKNAFKENGGPTELLCNASKPHPVVEHGYSGIDVNVRSDSPTWTDNGIGELPPDSLSVDAVLARQIINGESGNVFLDEIVSVHLEQFSAHVYNLETETNWYVADGVVSHNCRSITIPILKSWREMGIDVDEIPPSTRASFNGQVPATLSFTDFLKENPEVAKEVLGATRARLLLNGDMPVQAFVNDKGQTLTLAQLREKRAGYFKKAGL